MGFQKKIKEFEASRFSFVHLFWQKRNKVPSFLVKQFSGAVVSTEVISHLRQKHLFVSPKDAERKLMRIICMPETESQPPKEKKDVTEKFEMDGMMQGGGKTPNTPD